MYVLLPRCSDEIVLNCMLRVLSVSAVLTVQLAAFMASVFFPPVLDEG